MNKKAIASALAVGLAGTASAQSLRGSDTLFEMTQNMIALCDVNEGTLTVSYVGGGSTGGQNALQSSTQYVSPMSRFINAAGCDAAATGTNGTPRPVGGGPGSTRSGYAHSLDAIAILRDNSVDSEAGTCTTLRHSGTLTVDPTANGEPAATADLDCGQASNCPGGVYTFTQWQQVLRVLYAGRHNPVPSWNECLIEAPSAPSAANEAKDCNSDVRHTLVKNWGNLFEGGCAGAACVELKHAFRRDDISGTTDTLLSLLSLPGIFSGTGEYQRNAVGVDSLGGNGTFCNGNEFEDLDPIRSVCAGTGEPGESVCQRVTFAREKPTVGTRVATLGTATGQFTATQYPQLQNVWDAIPALPGPAAGDLGVVLPIVMPTTLADQYPNSAPCGGDFSFAPMPPSSRTSNELCPEGLAKRAGLCRWPIETRALPTSPARFGCINRSNQRPPGGVSATRMDARVYNLTTRRVNGQIPFIQRKPCGATPPVGVPSDPNIPDAEEIAQACAPANRTFINNSYYRIHQRAALAEAGGTAFTCVEDNDTDQIGCLVRASPCSLGAAGLGALVTDAAGDSVPGTNTTLLLRSPLPIASGGAAVPANATAARRLLSTTGNTAGTCGGINDYAGRYPLSRKLWFNTFVGFGAALDASAATDGEVALANCWADRRFVDAAANKAGFIELTPTPAACALPVLNAANDLNSDGEISIADVPAATPPGCGLTAEFCQ